jgi:hypothetical protein
MPVVAPRAQPEGPVAVVAATAAEARVAASAPELRAGTPGYDVFPAALSAYLADPQAPPRVILCATRGPSARGLAFLARASERLLWPAPPADIDAAIGGLRERDFGRSPGRPARHERLRTALLLEGRVDPNRARAALAAVERAGPRDWIVESARHVRVTGAGLAALARAGIRWSALEPVELVAVYVSEDVARALRLRKGTSPRTPVWVRPRRGRR